MRILLLLLLFVSVAQAQGPSYLAMCHKDWNCSATQKLYKNQDTLFISYLAHTFGNECSCVKTLLKSNKPKVIRVHLSNSPCMRNKRCGKYEVFYGMTKAQASRAVLRGDKKVMAYFNARLKELSEMFSGVSGLTCYVSPCLECDLNENARRVLLHLVSTALPYCIPVDNPHRQRCIRGYVCESHGAFPSTTQPCIVDMDGTDGRQIDVKKWVDHHSQCDLAFYWEPYMNCIREGFIDPRRRDCRYDYSMFAKTRRVLCQFFYQSFDIC